MFKLLLNAGAVRGGEVFGLERELEGMKASGGGASGLQVSYMTQQT